MIEVEAFRVQVVCYNLDKIVVTGTGGGFMVHGLRSRVAGPGFRTHGYGSWFTV
jgi:hypothetical protein